MKKKIAMALALLMILVTLCACSPAKLIENAIKKETGQDIKIDADGDSLTVQGKDGESIEISSGEDTKWPADKMGNLPEIKGKITTSIATDKGCVVSLDDVSRGEAEAYIEKLKKMNLSNVFETTTDSIIGYSGNDGEQQITFTYSGDDKKGSVVLSYSNGK